MELQCASCGMPIKEDEVSCSACGAAMSCDGESCSCECGNAVAAKDVKCDQCLEG